MDLVEYGNIGYFVVGAVLAYQLYVTIRVVRAVEYSRGQKVVQGFLIWTLPLLGAALCHTVLYTMTDRSRPIDKKYLEDDNLDGVSGRLEGRGGSHHRHKQSGSDADAGADGGGD